MQVAFTTIVLAPRFGWQPCPKRPLRLNLYDEVRQMGFDGLEWSPRWCDVDHLSNAETSMLGKEVIDRGLAVSAINLNRFILTRCPEAAAHRQRLQRTIDVAPHLGTALIIISLSLPVVPNQPRPALSGQTVGMEEFAETADFLRIAARQANDQGIELVLELHDDGLLDTPQLCLRMLDEIDAPNVSINPDLGNLVRQSGATAWREALEQLAPRAGYWHVKNYRAVQPAPLWDGDIDYAEAVSVMKQVGYDGWVSIESYFGGDVMRLQRESLDWLRGAIARQAL